MKSVSLKDPTQSTMPLFASVKKHIIFCILALIFIAPQCIASVQIHGKDASLILEAAESLFKAMKAKNYPEIWKFLSQKTCDTIIDDVSKAISKSGVPISKEELVSDFKSGGMHASAYWEAYLGVFDPTLILDHSKWEIGKIQRKEGEIIFRYKKSEHPTILKLFKEDDVWKVGMEETFRPRRWLLP